MSAPGSQLTHPLASGAVNALVQCGALVDKETLKGTALTLVSSSGVVAAVQQLLDLKADINHETRIGFTALLAACSTQQVKTVNTFLCQGAKPSFTTRSGNKATTLVEALASSGPRTSLMEAFHAYEVCGPTMFSATFSPLLQLLR